MSYTFDDREASVSLFSYNTKNRKINTEIVVILSQDIAQNQLMMVDE